MASAFGHGSGITFSTVLSGLLGEPGAVWEAAEGARGSRSSARWANEEAFPQLGCPIATFNFSYLPAAGRRGGRTIPPRVVPALDTASALGSPP